jgi:site-specific DNA recombinase
MEAKRRCAIYARYSSDLQRESSIEDQVRKCRERAARDWSIADGYTVSDEAVSGESIEGRPALKALLAAAKLRPKPFDCVLVEDTSRLSRHPADQRRIIDIFTFNGVDVVSVTQGIDTAQDNARTLLAVHGMIDEQYLVGLRQKVHRGQEGRALHGYTTGGRVYGYRNVPIEDGSRIGKYGRPYVVGVELEIIPKQAAVVVRIFRMYAEGMGQGAIAKRLNKEGIRGPNGPWSRYTIHENLRNERYRGVFVWGRTKKDRDPETGRKVSRDTPESQWRRVEVPQWRIVPEELWQAVELRRKAAATTFHKLGGMSRTERSRRYLFSGILRCGECGSSMVISTGGGRRGYVKYGCHAHKHNGTCGNRLMIRQDRLEEQLLTAIEQRFLGSRMLDYAVKRCEDEMRKRLAAMERQGSIATVDSLKKDLEDRRQRRSRIIEALETGGDIETLVGRMRELENEIKRIETAIADYRPIRLAVALSEIREHVTNSCLRLKALLTIDSDGDFARAKDALAKHIGALVLTPTAQAGRPMYKVSGSVNIPADSEKCRMQLVARDGIEPPTPAFSGLLTDNAKWFRISAGCSWKKSYERGVLVLIGMI